MNKAVIVLTTAMAVTACATDSPPPPVGPPPPPPPMMRDTVTPAHDMCEVDTLAGQRLDMLAEIHGYREAIGANSGRSSVADTETQELILAFETDLDASYRFATASCRTYNRCLEENSFDESLCQDSAALWHDGQDRFHDLSERLALVRERIASDCHDCRSTASHPDPDRRHHHDDDGDGSLMGSVFSTGPN